MASSSGGRGAHCFKAYLHRWGLVRDGGQGCESSDGTGTGIPHRQRRAARYLLPHAPTSRLKERGTNIARASISAQRKRKGLGHATYGRPTCVSRV